MISVTKAAGHAFDFFYFAVESFGKSIGNPMMDIRNDVIEVIFDGLCSGDYRFESGMGSPEIPSLKELASPCFTGIIPEMTQVFFDGPSPRHVKVGILQPAERACKKFCVSEVR
jgi:hypothetical protein